MTQSLHGRQMQASLKLGEALGRLKLAYSLLDLLGASFLSRTERVHQAREEVEQAIAAIEAAVKEG